MAQHIYMNQMVGDAHPYETYDEVVLETDGTGKVKVGPEGCLITEPRRISGWTVTGSDLLIEVAEEEACVIKDEDAPGGLDEISPYMPEFTVRLTIGLDGQLENGTEGKPSILRRFPLVKVT